MRLIDWALNSADEEYSSASLTVPTSRSSIRFASLPALALGEEMRRRHDAGETIHELAEKTGITYATVKFWCSNSRRSKDAERAANPKRVTDLDEPICITA